jgi:hypothetical protein
MKSVTYEGVCSCMHNIRLVIVKVFLVLRRKFLVCSFESQGEGKKGIEEGRDENPIIYLTKVLESERNFSDVYKGDIMKAL